MNEDLTPNKNVKISPKDNFYTLIRQNWTTEQVNDIEKTVDIRLNDEKANCLFGGEDDFYRRLCRLYFDCREEYNTFIQNIGNATNRLHNLELKVIQDKHSDRIQESFSFVKRTLENIYLLKSSSSLGKSWAEVISKSYSAHVKQENKGVTLSSYKEKIITELSCAICDLLLDSQEIIEKIELKTFFDLSTSLLMDYRAGKLKFDKIVIFPNNTNLKNIVVKNQAIIEDVLKYSLQNSIEKYSYLSNPSIDIDELKERKTKLRHIIVRRIVMVLIFNKVIDKTTNTESTFKDIRGNYMQISNDIGALIHDLLIIFKLIDDEEKLNDRKLDKANKIRSYGGYAGKSSICLLDSFSYGDITDNPVECWQKYNKRMGYL